LRSLPIACQKPVRVSRPGNREQRQNRNDGQCSHTSIVVFDCGQKRQSLAHFLDDQEKHHGAPAAGGYPGSLPARAPSAVADFSKAISIDPDAIYNCVMRG
jgi:hypothetical protein